MSLANITQSVIPSSEEQSLARASSETILKFGNSLPEVSLVGDGLDCPIPSSAAQQVAKMLVLMADGQPVEVVPGLPELTVHQAAMFLGEPEGYVKELLRDNLLEHRQDGDQLLIKRDSLLEFEQEQKISRAAMDEVVRLSVEMGLYDEE